MNLKKRILLVEDDPNFGIILRDFLRMNEYDVILAKNGMEGFEKFKKFEFNLCICIQCCKYLADDLTHIHFSYIFIVSVLIR